MRKLSSWAKYNPRIARLIITLSEILLFILAFKLGLLLLKSGIRLPNLVLIISILFFLTAYIIYPKIRSKNFKGRYWYRRLCYFLVGLATFLLTSFIVNNDKILSWNVYTPLSGSYLSLPSMPKDSSAKSLSKKEVRRELKTLRKKKRENEGLKALYFILIVVGGLGLLYLTAGLACSLSCNGNDAAAWLVGLLGGGGTIFLCIWLLRKLNTKNKKSTQQTSFVPE